VVEICESLKLLCSRLFFTYVLQRWF